MAFGDKTDPDDLAAAYAILTFVFGAVLLWNHVFHFATPSNAGPTFLIIGLVCWIASGFFAYAINHEV